MHSPRVTTRTSADSVPIPAPFPAPFPRAVRLPTADDRHATFRIGDTALPALLVDLPCIIESHRTFDRRQFYKVQDISQVRPAAR